MSMRDVKIRVIEQTSWFSTGIVSEDELLGMAKGFGPDGSEWDGVLCIHTDRVSWVLPGEVEDDAMPRLLGLRAYNSGGELHAVRDGIGRPFSFRTVSDDAALPDAEMFDSHFDDTQFLDIDTNRSHGNNYVTTGGGEYRLPVEDAERIVVRNYIVYGKDDGMARIVDFRIVRLLRGGSDV